LQQRHDERAILRKRSQAHSAGTRGVWKGRRRQI